MHAEASSGALNARCKLVSGRQKAQVALPLRLHLPHGEVAALIAAQAGLAKPKRGAPTRDELVRKACSDLICQQVALYWRREDLNDAGSPLHRTFVDPVRVALTGKTAIMAYVGSHFVLGQLLCSLQEHAAICARQSPAARWLTMIAVPHNTSCLNLLLILMQVWNLACRCPDGRWLPAPAQSQHSCEPHGFCPLHSVSWRAAVVSGGQHPRTARWRYGYAREAGYQLTCAPVGAARWQIPCIES